MGQSFSTTESLLSHREYAERGAYATVLTQESVLDSAGAAGDTYRVKARRGLTPRRAAQEAVALLLLLGLVLLIHGYHPWSDDAAIYISGLRKMIDPSLFPRDAVFVLAHTRVSVFSHVLALLATTFHLRLQHLLLAGYLASVLLFLYASRRLALRIFQDQRTGWIATLFAAACYTLPIAGTAIFVMDPYLSARSFSTPLSMLAVAAALDHSWRGTLFWTLLTLIMHPQMGVYAAGFIVLLILADRRHLRAAVALSAAAILGCGVLWLADLHSPVTEAYREAVLSRTYFFPGLWKWYEYLGLASPVVLFALVWRRSRPESPAAKTAAAAVLVGTAACIAAFAFVHTGGPYFLARVQLLRSFQMIYLVGLVMLGGWIGQTFSGRRTWIAALLFLGAAAGMYAAQLKMYPGSAHLEWPGTAPVNPWGEALVWIRSHTPRDAVFAISPDLLDHPAEDLPGFRALAERSVVVDNKDEGVASIFPAVAPAWKQRSEATADLDQLRPEERFSGLSPYGVSWLLLAPKAVDPGQCPYRNSAVAVCRLTR